ncbi:hypothetical protein BKA64DRAFT_757540 [Cadophora sp. MPI-SDFR-AT-0126]|nr:hypothetical protein BKA64DRAFT_757540 [Leotiomycetes sp. MPI-SDFR-AT-0126]
MGKSDPVIETSSLSPSTSSSDPSTSTFRTIIANNSKLYNLSLLPLNSTTPLFHITNSSFTPHKPDITITSGTATGPVLGVIKLNALSSNVVALGDPAKTEQMQWERFQSMKDWTHSRYEFEFVDGETGERRIFTWRRTRQRFWDDQPDMELCENVGVGAEKSGGEAELGEVLAVYKGCQGFFSRTRGKFHLRKGWRVKSVREVSGVGVEIDGGGEGGGEGGGDEKWGDWEVMVLLTGCGAIETARRRSRARRGAGASSGGGGGG